MVSEHSLRAAAAGGADAAAVWLTRAAITERGRDRDEVAATLLERAETGVPMPSIRLTQVPVFHGYSLSFWIEFEDAPDVNALELSVRKGHGGVSHGVEI